MSKDKSQEVSRESKDAFNAWQDYSRMVGERIESMMRDGTKRYESLYELWSDYSKKMAEQMANLSPDDDMDFGKMGETWTDYSSKIGDMFAELMGNEPGQYKDLYAVWNDYSDTMGERLSDMMNGQFKEQRELYDIWMDTFSMKDQGSHGMPADVMTATKAYWEEFMSNLPSMSATMGNMSDPQGAYKELSKNWMSNYTKYMVNLMATKGVASMDGDLLGKNLESMQKGQEFLKDYFNIMGIPTKDNMDEIYQRLYKIDRKMREMSRAINGIDKKMGK
jgi:hypothetical protein